MHKSRFREAAFVHLYKIGLIMHRYNECKKRLSRHYKIPQ